MSSSEQKTFYQSINQRVRLETPVEIRKDREQIWGDFLKAWGESEGVLHNLCWQLRRLLEKELPNHYTSLMACLQSGDDSTVHQPDSVWLFFKRENKKFGHNTQCLINLENEISLRLNSPPGKRNNFTIVVKVIMDLSPPNTVNPLFDMNSKDCKEMQTTTRTEQRATTPAATVTDPMENESDADLVDTDTTTNTSTIGMEDGSNQTAHSSDTREQMHADDRSAPGMFHSPDPHCPHLNCACMLHNTHAHQSHVARKHAQHTSQIHCPTQYLMRILTHTHTLHHSPKQHSDLSHWSIHMHPHSIRIFAHIMFHAIQIGTCENMKSNCIPNTAEQRATTRAATVTDEKIKSDADLVDTDT
ncbi:hypothetical protein P879_06516, partial [Paragonimus westermani]